MNPFSISDMQQMQRTLQDKYRHLWEPISPETGKNKLLWMLGEVGEVIDIIKKNGEAAVMASPETRAALTEELADVLMYFNDILLCYGITEEELRTAYVGKFEKNMRRW